MPCQSPPDYARDRPMTMIDHELCTVTCIQIRLARKLAAKLDTAGRPRKRLDPISIDHGDRTVARQKKLITGESHRTLSRVGVGSSPTYVRSIRATRPRFHRVHSNEQRRSTVRVRIQAESSRHAKGVCGYHCSRCSLAFFLRQHTHSLTHCACRPYTGYTEMEFTTWGDYHPRTWAMVLFLFHIHAISFLQKIINSINWIMNSVHVHSTLRLRLHRLGIQS